MCQGNSQKKNHAILFIFLMAQMFSMGRTILFRRGICLVPRLRALTMDDVLHINFSNNQSKPNSGWLSKNKKHRLLRFNTARTDYFGMDLAQ
jgi:hypothetical protein